MRHNPACMARVLTLLFVLQFMGNSAWSAQSNCGEPFEVDLELQKVQRKFHGAYLTRPSQRSLLGRYLKRTGAKTTWKTFSKGPGYGEQLGPKRLVVAVSDETFPIFSELFFGSEWVSFVGHANMIYNGEFYNFNGGASSIQPMSRGHIFPVVLLKESESKRLKRYSALIKKYPGWMGGNPVKHPWNIEGYVTSGGYNNCTHWIGNMPIGDRLVTEYSFPPSYEFGETDLQPIVSKLKPYEHRDPKFHEVWKFPQGHEQFSHAIGLKKNNDAGEFASPGWVITSLIGHASTDRVPIVFAFVDDATAEIPKDLQYQFENPR